ncbi:MAG TPA: ABC transporter permease [Acidisarcina sp.]
MKSDFELVIQRRKGWQAVDLREIYLYRELLGFLMWRDIKIRYRQTMLGGLWAILQPLTAMIIFTFIFHKLAGVKSDGPPYPLFAFAGVAAWTFFSTAVGQASNSLISNQHLVSKVYFPRTFIPIGAIGAFLMDLALTLLLLGVLMIYYHWPVTLAVLELPLFVAGTFLASAGLGMAFSAVNVVYRDLKYAVPFFLAMGIYVTPVIYPSRYIPAKYHVLLALNPMTGMVEGFRHSLLGTAVSWPLIGESFLVSIILFLAGLMIFRRMETLFADVI